MTMTNTLPERPTERPSVSPQLRAVLDAAPIAHLATLMPDGGPHSVPLWIGIHDDHVVFMTGPRSRKALNLHRDPRLAISLVDPDNSFAPIILRGRVEAWLTGADAWPVVDAIATKYLGRPYGRDEERVVGLVRIEHGGAR